MCFSAKASASALLIGMSGALLLISKGDANNITFGIFFIFISLIQLMDLAIWLDLKNKVGLNKVATMIGPMLNVGQPLIFYIIKLLYFKDNGTMLYNALNYLYAIYTLNVFTSFIETGEWTTDMERNHLKWPWLKYAHPAPYLIMFVMNAFYLTDFRFSLYVSIITGFFLLMSHTYFAYHVGEVWCYFSAFIPIIVYFFL